MQLQAFHISHPFDSYYPQTFKTETLFESNVNSNETHPPWFFGDSIQTRKRLWIIWGKINWKLSTMICSINSRHWKEKQSSQKTQQSNLRMSQQSLTEGSTSLLTQVKKDLPYLGMISPAEKLTSSLTPSTVCFDLFLSSQQRKMVFPHT